MTKPSSKIIDVEPAFDDEQPVDRVGTNISFDADVLAAIKTYISTRRRQWRSVSHFVNFKVAEALGLEPKT